MLRISRVPYGALLVAGTLAACVPFLVPSPANALCYGSPTAYGAQDCRFVDSYVDADGHIQVVDPDHPLPVTGGGGGGGTGDASASNQTAVQAVAGSDSSKLVGVQGATGMKPIKTDGSGTTQPISATSLPLPSGAASAANQSTANSALAAIQTSAAASATAAKQDTGNTSLGSIDTKLSTSNTNTGNTATSAATTATNTGTTATNTGAVSTTVGSKTDAKSSATDSTSVSLIQIQKEISFVEQAINALLGTATDNPSTGCPNSTSAGTVMACQKALTAAAQAGTTSTGSAVPGSAIYIGGNSSGNLTGLIQADASAKIDISTATTTELVALTSGKKIYVTNYKVIAGGTGNFKFVYGTGTACGTGTTDLEGNNNLTAQSGSSDGGGLGPVLVVPAGNALCATTSAAVQMSGHVAYTKF